MKGGPFLFPLNSQDNMIQKEYKQIDFFVDDLNSESRIIKGYAATWDIDSVGDRIDPKAFDSTIVNNFLLPIERKGSPDIRFCREHSHRDVIGRILNLTVLPKGLYLEAYISETELGNDTYILLKDKALDRLSIGFTIEDKKDITYEGNIRVIKKLRLYEISVVTFPANENAEVFSVKSVDRKSMNKFENFFSSLSETEQDTILGSMRNFLTVSEQESVDENQKAMEMEVEDPADAADPAEESDSCEGMVCPDCGAMITCSACGNKETKSDEPDKSGLEDEIVKLEEYFSNESNSFEVTKMLKNFEILLEGYLKNNVR